MNIYDWIFCYKDGKYHPRKINKRNFPFKIKEKEIIISKRTLEDYIIKFADEYLEKKVDFGRVLDIFIEKTGGLYYDGVVVTDPEEGYPEYWVITVNLFQILFKKFPIVDENSDKLLFNIYKNPNLLTIEKFKYGLSYLFAYYRLYLLENSFWPWKKKRVIIED